MISVCTEKTKTIEGIKKMLHSAAIVYSSVCNKQIMFIYRKNSRDAEYHYYETYYDKKNFIHLVGCCSNKHVDAVKFYGLKIYLRKSKIRLISLMDL